ncbi:MAG: hypothetical protein ABI175_19695, partial [Polyangiales bacterium]
IDRVVARFSDPESGQSTGAIRFVMMRELILDAWLVAFERAAPGTTPVGFDDKQLRVALERHVIEEVLSERLGETVAATVITKRTDEARTTLALTVGTGRLEEALSAASGGVPGGGIVELASILRRRARAEIYLEIAISQPVEVTEAELRSAYGKPPAALVGKTFDEAAPSLRIFLRSGRLREASQAYYQAVRGRLKLEIVN